MCVIVCFFNLAEEEATRFKIFCENMKRIKSIQETEKGSAIYGVTKFADLSGEFIKISLLIFKVYKI